jgi:hypothetical protein
MRSPRHFVEWHGERFTVEPLNTSSQVPSRSSAWAVFRHGEFIGTLPSRPQETTKEFEVRCLAWLRDLLGAAPPVPPRESSRRSHEAPSWEARLRPEFATRYPYLTPGVWEPAAVLADRVVASLLGRPDCRFVSRERVLDPEHFEFRGSDPRPGASSRRREDA